MRERKFSTSYQWSLTSRRKSINKRKKGKKKESHMHNSTALHTDIYPFTTHYKGWKIRKWKGGVGPRARVDPITFLGPGRGGTEQGAGEERYESWEAELLVPGAGCSLFRVVARSRPDRHCSLKKPPCNSSEVKESCESPTMAHSKIKIKIFSRKIFFFSLHA